jgi:hypothetical protein
MTNPLDNEVYGDKRVDNENAALNGNPGKPQSEYQQFDHDQPKIDPSDFEGTDQKVVPGAAVPAESDNTAS